MEFEMRPRRIIMVMGTAALLAANTIATASALDQDHATTNPGASAPNSSTGNQTNPQGGAKTNINAGTQGQTSTQRNPSTQAQTANMDRFSRNSGTQGRSLNTPLN